MYLLCQKYYGNTKNRDTCWHVIVANTIEEINSFMISNKLEHFRDINDKVSGGSIITDNDGRQYDYEIEYVSRIP